MNIFEVFKVFITEIENFLGDDIKIKLKNLYSE